MAELSNVLTVNIVTPNGFVYDHHADMVVVKTIAGDLGIMANHEPIVAPLVIGEIRVKRTDNPGHEIDLHHPASVKITTHKAGEKVTVSADAKFVWIDGEKYSILDRDAEVDVYKYGGSGNTEGGKTEKPEYEYRIECDVQDDGNTADACHGGSIRTELDEGKQALCDARNEI